MSERQAKAARKATNAALVARREMIEKYKPKCPDCDQPFTAEQHVNQCGFCGWYICDACVGDRHRCKLTRGK